MPDPNTIGTPVPTSTMKAPGSGVGESKFKQIESSTGAQTYALSIATVMQVDYEKLHVTLRTESGETFENSPINLTFPGAGARHFLGALPLAGDVAVVGWGAGESGKTRQPYVLGWFASPTAGYDWWVMQPFGQDEFNLTPKNRETFEGIANRTRYKLRHMLPGNIVASSSQGSDLVLNEGVLLSNRRGNEIRLRDQDQALVVSSLQQFHAGSGFRVYAGMVQRDATLLPSSMFSDGIFWDAPGQVDSEGAPLIESNLGAAPIGYGKLTPNKVFQQDSSGNRQSIFTNGDGTTAFPFGGNVDPYVFLQKGLFIDTTGSSLVGLSDASYGGKAIYRVSDSGSNATIDTQADALTEYRIEVSHVSNGTLPVTEQTDGFDADRLPDSVPRLPSPLNNSPAAPFIEFVMGSVVGNDPFSIPGKSLYGVPLRPSIFDSLGATVASPNIGSGIGWEIPEHASFLFKVAPATDPAGQPSFWSVTKDGRAKASVMGPGTDFSAEVNFGAGFRIAAGITPSGESVRLDAQGKIRIRSERGDNTGRGVELTSTQGTIYIRGAGQAGTTMPSGVPSEPGVTLQSDTDCLIKATRTITLSASALNLQDISSLSMSANAALNMKAGDNISQVSKTRDITSMGKSTESYTGPKNGLPTNGSVREVHINTTPITGFVGGTADEYSLVYGNRQETILIGNHTTAVAVGNATYAVGAGTWTAASGVNTIVASPGGIAITATVGVASFAAVAGATSITGSTAVLVASAGPVTIRGTVVSLVAPGVKIGGIVCGSDLDPVSGLPLVALGMGSPTHLLAIG